MFAPRRAPLAALCLVGLTACPRSPAPTPPADVAARPDVPRPAIDAPPAPTDAALDAPDVPASADRSAVDRACAELTTASLARWDALVRAHSPDSVPVLYGASERARVRRRWECARTTDGAWALALEAHGLAVAFVRPDGSTARVRPPGCSADPSTPGFVGAALAAQPVAGGAPGAVVVCDNGRGAVISLAPDGLHTAPLPFAGRDVRLADFDRDGLFDVATTSTGPGGVVFVAHALATGGFSQDDELTRVALRGQCPERPTSLLATEGAEPEVYGEPNGESALARRVVCARVWNVSPAAITALVDRAETDGPPRDPSSGPIDAGAAPSDGGARFALPRATLLALATTQPPQHLRPMALPPAPATAETTSDAGASADAATPADAGASTMTSAVASACAAAADRVRRLTTAEVTRAGESLTDAGTDTVDGRPVLRRMGIVRRSLGRCVPTAGGAWVLSLRAIERTSGQDDSTPRFRARWAPDFVRADGTRVEGPEGPALVDEGCDHDELDAFAGSDLDGDGRGELALRGTHYWCGDGDGDNPIAVTVFTARGDRVAPYAPFAAVGAVESFLDFDHDGRLDFVDGERWGRIECDPVGVGVDDSPGPASLWHALPDGRFSRTDAVARAFLRRGSCARPPRRIYGSPAAEGQDERRDGSPALFRAVCAMAHGWSIERVQLQAIADLRARGPMRSRFACNDLEWLSWRLLAGLPTGP